MHCCLYLNIYVYNLDIVDISNYNKLKYYSRMHQLSLWSASLPGLAVRSNVLVF